MINNSFAALPVALFHGQLRLPHSSFSAEELSIGGIRTVDEIIEPVMPAVSMVEKN